MIKCFWTMSSKSILVIFRAIKKVVLHPRYALSFFSSLGRNGVRETFQKLKIVLLPPPSPIPSYLKREYQEWISKFDTLTEADFEQIKKHIKEMKKKPLISILMPTYNTNPLYLRQAIESIKNQIYESWELCIADDCSTIPEVKQIINEYLLSDHRIKSVFRQQNGLISVCSNSALELCSGEFTVLFYHEDEIPRHALYLVVVAINEMNGAVDLLYSDEDKIDGEGRRFDPYFKPDWDNYLILSQNFLAHMGVYRTSILKEIGGFRKGFEGSQDYDLLLRFIAQIDNSRIRHIPFILYHWRKFEGNASYSTNHQSISCPSAKRALIDYHQAKGNSVLIELAGYWKTEFLLAEPYPLVSIIIPSKDQVDLLKRCVSSLIEKTQYEPFEIVIIDNRSEEENTFLYYEELKKYKNIRVEFDRLPFNYSRLNNLGVSLAKGNVFVFLNNDTEVIEPLWLKKMVSLLMREDVGVVGAKLLYPNGVVQHAGVISGMCIIAAHVREVNYFGFSFLTRNLTAVTGACLAIKRDVLKRAGGWDEKELVVAYNDVDLCFKVTSLNLSVLICPDALLYHHESASRGADNTLDKKRLNRKECRTMISRYGPRIKNDRFYNQNLTLDLEEYSLAIHPFIRKPWRPWIELICPFHRGDVLLAIQVASTAMQLGRQVRLHVSEQLMDWVKSFDLNFPVESIPVGIPAAENTFSVFQQAVEAVMKRPDHSSCFALSHQRDFKHLGLDIVEHLLNELRLPIDTELFNLVPKEKSFESLIEIDERTVLLHPIGGWELKRFPPDLVQQICDICKFNGFKVVQIGGSSDKRYYGCDEYYLQNHSLEEWTAIFKSAGAIICADTWSSHFAAILDVNHAVIYGSTTAEFTNSRRHFASRSSSYLVLDSFVPCSPCDSFNCKIDGGKKCYGYKIDASKLDLFLKELYNNEVLFANQLTTHYPSHIQER